MLIRWLFFLIFGFAVLSFNNIVFNSNGFIIENILYSAIILSIFIALVEILKNLREKYIFIIYISVLLKTTALILFSVDTNDDLVAILVFTLVFSISSFISIKLNSIFAYILYFVFILIVIFSIINLESHFAEEEFLTLAQGMIVSCVWLGLSVVYSVILKIQNPKGIETLENKSYYIILSFIVIAFLTIIVAIRYQKSFTQRHDSNKFSLSYNKPFICEYNSDNSEYDEKVDSFIVFNRIVNLILDNKNKSVPEYGMLALSTGDVHWANSFRAALLSEARDSLYTSSYGSVKFHQYFAALRVYYYLKVNERFVDLFNEDDKKIITDWFNKINTRAQTVDWVDWLYAIPMGSWPQGPYHNQEVGAGLLALLEKSNLVNPALSKANHAYLRDNLAGWSGGFRVTDDTLIYQREWITNALFQDMYKPSSSFQNKALSFEWLKLQSLPNGDVISYNLPREYRFSLAPLFYLGAQLTSDETLIWLADRSARLAAQQGIPVFAQPGAERSPSTRLKARAPQSGSCLLFGDAGLPGQRVALMPDKIVLRDGWAEDDVVALVNLRFAGWHRYKATGAVVGIFHRNLLVADRLDSAQQWAILPAGRSLVRDKRIPREAVNGLTISDRGMTRLVKAFTGLGSLWSQDPPQYAEVYHLDFGTERDSVKLRMPWDGTIWEREISLDHRRRELTVIDRVDSPWKRPFLLNWHIVNAKVLKSYDNRLIVNDCVSIDINQHPKDHSFRLEKQLRGSDVTISLSSNSDYLVITKFSFSCNK